MDFVNKTLFVLSDGMLVPVMVALIFFFVRALMLAGGFFGQAVQRVRSRTAEKALIDAAKGTDTIASQFESLPLRTTFFALFTGRMLQEKREGELSEKVLAEAQIRFDKDCDSLRILMRVGPMLGLMGTIIPMGPALTGLATGDIAMMAQNMQIAFATTVVGLFCGIVGFVLHAIQKRWHTEDMVGLAHLYEVLHATK